MVITPVVCRLGVHSILPYAVAARIFRGTKLFCWAVVAVVTSTLQTVRWLVIIHIYQHMHLTELTIICKLVPSYVFLLEDFSTKEKMYQYINLLCTIFGC
jgi:hypothetical protein